MGARDISGQFTARNTDRGATDNAFWSGMNPEPLWKSLNVNLGVAACCGYK